MSDRNIDHLDPKLQPLCNKFIVQCLAEGIHAFVIETFRSKEDQDSDYAKGRTTPGPIITNAKGGESPHNCTLDGKPAARAFDFAISLAKGALDWNAQDSQWKRAIEIGESLGLYSGDHFPRKDSDHLEFKDWKNI